MFNFDEVQVNKLSEIRQKGQDPYPIGQSDIVDLQNLLRYQELSNLELEKVSVIKVAGRLRFKNEIGNLGFGRIESQGLKLQICIQKNNISKNDFDTWKNLDLGDWIVGTGKFIRSRSGELTLNLNKISLYSKCIQSMPSKVNGLTDLESRQRMRYLDLIVNDESKEKFKIRFEIIKKVRDFFQSLNFMEVETPILQNIAGGANAKPFFTHHNTLDIDMFLRIAPELYLKRLLVGGFERIFEIGKNFRNEGISTRHNPEFTVIEFYQAHATYKTLMSLVKELIISLIPNDSLIVNYQNKIIDFNNWKIISFKDSFSELGINDPWSQEELSLFWKNLSLENKSYEIEELQSLILETCIEPTFINPTFIIQHPVHMNPLARPNDLDPRVTDNFELFINRLEIAPGFTELNDPLAQAKVFQKQAELKEKGDQEAMYFDYDFIHALSYGMVPAAGCGIGLDRLIMLMTNSNSIRDIILFPTMKTKEK